MKRHIAILILLVVAITSVVWAQEPVDLYVVSRIKSEAFENSQVMETLSFLTDVHGPRLTGSPNYKVAAKWAADKMTEWGLVNAHLEPWGTFGRGWTAERFSIEMVEPQYMPMIAYPKAWTSGTNGPISGAPVLVQITSEADLDKYKGKLRGAIVMTQPAREAATHFEADAKRHTDEDLQRLAQAPEPGARPAQRQQQFQGQRGLQERIARFFREEGVAVLLEPSRSEHGTIFVGSGGQFRANTEPGLPALVVAVEHYARVARLLQKNIPVKLEINIQTRFHEDDLNGYNVIAEIPGTDPRLKEELVMLGGHLDSWHSGTGTTDNAAGCSVAMEAVRILKAIGAQPRRTIRLALWGGEEQGLLGSRGYVAQHFADRATMQLKPGHAKLSAYFNLDNGTGKIRGVYLQGNEMVRPVFEAYLRPFHDLGATTLTIRNTGGTDHLAFDAVGLPGFQFIQDPVDYEPRTHHSNMDLYDRALRGDLMQASAIMASFVYHTAMRDEKLPRKPLPKPQPQGPGGRP
jgi:hypothetical protein